MDGQVHLSGSIAYCPQQTWIRNMTLQDNILMGSTFDQCFYDSVLDSCALKPDLAILPRGDQTEIGEKGTNLSGGQKQRVSLARAVYSNKDIYLLDDPLSAVDAHVGNHLFTHCICGLLQSKLRILVTHQLQVLPQCDRIIVLENGMIAHQGTFQELSEKGVNFHTVTAAEESEQPDLEQADQKCSVPDLSKKTHQTVPVEPSENLTGDLTSEEEHAEGAVNTSVYLKYFLSFGKPLLLTALLFCVCTEVFYELYTVWLAYWPSDDVTILSQNYLGEWRNLVVYFVLTAFYVASVAMRNTCWFQGAYKASVKLHQGLLDSIFAAGMDFFYQTPKGRIINRFSKDMTVIDQELPDMISDFLLTFFQLVAEFFIMSIACPPFIILLIVIIIAYYWLQRFYRPVNRDLTRLRTIHSSPLYEHYSETIDGLESIRAYEMQNAQKNDNFARVNRNSMTLYLQLAISRWMGVRVGFLGAVVVLSVAGMGLLLEYFDMSSPLIYMSLYYSTTCTGALNWGIRSFTTMEAHMAHVERILHYTNNVAPELTCPACVDGIIPPDWPNKGVITFENVCARYSETKPMVLHNINFSIQSAEKIGVVGRTGAGKSTLTLVLTRILPLSSGRIFIDGVDIFSLSLGKLRTSLGIVPQDPVLLAGTIRSNLDPHGRFSDDQIWEVLQRVCLFDFVQNRTGRLRSEIAEGGNNISVGQRQLLCFARAILGGAKIILLDEATASVDPETDSIIQTTIRKAFADRVVITVAHRLSTIMDYDRILVLDKGEVSQFDSPSALLKQPGIFQSLVNEAIASGSVSSSMVSDL
jgi:ABC-type multidrug transport system fused ATPase/permease subunit